MERTTSLMTSNLQVAKKASVLRKRKSKLKLDTGGCPAQNATTANLPGSGGSHINVSSNPVPASNATESDNEVLCYDTGEEHKSGESQGSVVTWRMCALHFVISLVRPPMNYQPFDLHSNPNVFHSIEFWKYQKIPHFSEKDVPMKKPLLLLQSVLEKGIFLGFFFPGSRP